VVIIDLDAAYRTMQHCSRCSRYHALRGNVFFDALRHGGTTGCIAAKK